MKKRIALALIGVLAVTGLATGCSSKETASEDNVIKVGASITPHAEVLYELEETLAEAGYTLEVVEYTDYVIPNTALFDGDIDANYFQHVPYLETFNEENDTDLVPVFSVHFEPLSLYAGKLADLALLGDGGKVAVPNDTSNEARALLLLEELGFITLADGVGLTATIQDITNNPLNLEIVEIEAAQLVRTLPDVDFAVITGNYALEGGLTAADVVASESNESVGAETYKNVVAVKAGNENDAKTLALIEAFEKSSVSEFITETYGGVVVPLF